MRDICGFEGAAVAVRTLSQMYLCSVAFAACFDRVKIQGPTCDIGKYCFL